MNDPAMLLKTYRYVGAGEQSIQAVQAHRIVDARGGRIVTSTLHFDQPNEISYSWVGTIEEFRSNFESVDP